ncbi:MAG: cupin domain-containing protein [Alphaproteobacteria bacterium]|nr:cupin domain-containing protein [Alphaproteobacteria bacterium]
MASRRRGAAPHTDRMVISPVTDLPLIVHRQILSARRAKSADGCLRLFERNGWTNGWVNGVYDYHHYHAATHEALGVISGKASVCFGGPDGPVVTVKAGDVVIIPAGIAHKRVAATGKVVIVGAYPDGRRPDRNLGVPGPAKTRQVARVPRPATDPVFGAAGGLRKFWSAA